MDGWDAAGGHGGQAGDTGPRQRCRQRSLSPKNCAPWLKKGTGQGRRWGRPGFERAPRSSGHEATALATSVPSGDGKGRE